ncbi:peroxiredoxin family protein [Cellulomonas sp. SG140]|uniref:peroxiredoxin family protein n=1 Tax=Cellulomonas sp. SG140 TaxID=2976536 RepID=UPI0021E94F98|nr:peroxiredoxin family protein [Cellulomonas sp. SG140]
MTSGSAVKRELRREEIVAAAKKKKAAADRRHRQIRLGAWVVGVLVVAGLVTAGLLSARPTQSVATRVAPDFTLKASDGTSVTLSELRGKPVVLYFSEGAGCDACLVQMQKIEQDSGFADKGITVLPIVMNTADEINADRTRIGVKSAFYLDDGKVSKEYDVLGKGMHAGLPGHGFVLVNAAGKEVWSAEYPSMFLAPDQLLKEVTSRL